MISKIYVFTRRECPNCPAAKQIAEDVAVDMNVSISIINADDIDDDLQDELLENQIFVFSTPLVLIKNGDGEIRQFSVVSPPDFEELRTALGGL